MFEIAIAFDLYAAIKWNSLNYIDYVGCHQSGSCEDLWELAIMA